MKTSKGIISMVLIVAVLFLVGVAQAEDRMAIKPGLTKPQTVPMEKMQMAQPCPDLAVTEIKYEIVQTYPDAPQSMAKVRVTAIARNQGKGPLPFSGKLQLFGDAQKLAEQPFTNVPPGGEVKASHELKWIVGSSVGQFFIGKIVYDPAVLQNKYEQDCDFGNNEKKRSAEDISSLIPGKSVQMKPIPKGIAQPPKTRPLDKVQDVK